jgi:hypothetical protein
MNDLGHQLRDEARRIRPQVPSALAPRIRAAIAAAPVVTSSAQRIAWLPLAIAASVLLAAGIAWLARSATAESASPLAVVVPAPPGITDLMRAASAAREQAPQHDEWNALQADLAAAARTVRGAIPF